MSVRLWLSALVALAVVSCGGVPKHRYGVDHVRFEGVEEFDEESLRVCLASSPRPRVGISAGALSSVSCGEPPFDRPNLGIALWSWPWTEWQLYDKVLLAQDVRRIERWYAARGHFEAEVLSVEVSPAQAEESDTIDPDEPEPGCDRVRRRQGCSVDIRIEVREGRPTRVTSVELHGHEGLDAELRGAIEGAVVLGEGDRFDEAHYDRSKQGIAGVLAARGYARARVRGIAHVDRPGREARVELEVDPGETCAFGEVRLEGEGELPSRPIVAAVKIEPGSTFDPQALQDAQHAIYTLGAFSAVTVEPIVGEEEECVVNIRTRVTPARQHRFGLGGGAQAGVLRSANDEIQSVPQWDLHLTGRYENRNLFGGLRRLTLEARPRMIFQQSFPGVTTPRPGLHTNAELRQPGFLEPRTTLVIGTTYDFGPDPFDTFFRHRVDSRVGLERNFWHHQIFLSPGVRTSFYRVPSGETQSDGSPAPADYDLVFPELVARLDLRDDPQRPTKGLFLQSSLHVAGYWLPSSWSYVRLLPEVRAYIPLPRGITVALRFGLGMLFVSDADADLDPQSQELGPRDYRLRGGGATDNRGYLPGRLGDGRDGGTRRWLANLELRVPLGESLGVTLFADAGDVSRRTRFRFDHPQMSVGFGFRYYTIVPLRIDFGVRVRRAEVFGPDERERVASDDTVFKLGRLKLFPGAFHISIGESF